MRIPNKLYNEISEIIRITASYLAHRETTVDAIKNHLLKKFKDVNENIIKQNTNSVTLHVSSIDRTLATISICDEFLEALEVHYPEYFI